MSDLFISPRLTIRESELTFTTARSGGPGGQNVNKVNSKVTLRWSPSQCPGLSTAWQRRFETRFGNRINREGELVLHSEKYRDQGRNHADVRKRLVDMLLACQSPPKARKATKPTRGSQVRRLNQKSAQSQKKQNRRSPRQDD
ncbi:Peptidyl-tRNA hydrolase ArfB [Planctomycetes bacterium CA13]|uniref:Peptidyl-tRNA hydrolase ArfB n=1 Tax=Novipirellula herctigrandis TaxID=2527986 RepID=A0A5C5YNP3_9BACT|nr:Peptidyl-tRNA hydrolase ArfB [Planctomycetes bacterium CA13]